MFINRMNEVSSKGKHIAMDSTVQVIVFLLLFVINDMNFSYYFCGCTYLIIAITIVVLVVSVNHNMTSQKL